METSAAKMFIQESIARAIMARGRIHHCLSQIKDEDAWWVPAEGCNSIGVIIQHLMGNVRQWIISGVGGAPDIRQRAREFVATEKTSAAELADRMDNMLDQVVEALSCLPADQLVAERHIQGFDVTTLGAIYATMTHLELHAGQITLLTRLRLGRDYKDYWRPATIEQGKIGLL